MPHAFILPDYLMSKEAGKQYCPLECTDLCLPFFSDLSDFAAWRSLATSPLCGEKAFKNKTKVQHLVSCVCPMQYKGYLNPVR